MFFVNKRMAHNNDVKKVKPRAGSPLKLAIAALSVLSAALAVSCCLMGYHLQCAQKSLSVSQRQVIEAASYLRHADSVVDDYAGRIETYIQYPSYVRRADRYDFYNTFENYQRITAFRIRIHSRGTKPSQLKNKAEGFRHEQRFVNGHRHRAQIFLVRYFCGIYSFVSQNQIIESQKQRFL